MYSSAEARWPAAAASASSVADFAKKKPATQARERPYDTHAIRRTGSVFLRASGLIA